MYSNKLLIPVNSERGGGSGGREGGGGGRGGGAGGGGGGRGLARRSPESRESPSSEEGRKEVERNGNEEGNFRS